MKKTIELAASGNVRDLEELANFEVDKCMSRWNNDKALRDNYKKIILPSLNERKPKRDERLGTRNVLLIQRMEMKQWVKNEIELKRFSTEEEESDDVMDFDIPVYEKLKSGTTLIVNRYSYSGVAFSSAKNLGIEWCKAPEMGLLAPDSVIYLDISLERAAERGGYGDEIYKRVDFQKNVAGFYQTLRDSSWKIIDAGETMEQVEKKIQEVVSSSYFTVNQG